MKSLWYDAKGDWHQAHEQVDQLIDQQSAWVHAYLHRKEGDIWNADYWYKKAGLIRPNQSLEEEWEQLVLHFLRQINILRSVSPACLAVLRIKYYPVLSRLTSLIGSNLQNI